MFRKYILPIIVFIIYKLWSSSWRLTVYEPPELQNRIKNKEPFILAHWHGDELSLLHFVKRYSFATMTSTSKDGELIDKVIRWQGGVTSRGSSTRGAISALKGLIRIIKSGKFNASMAVDGPKGPYHKAKPGVFELAKLLQIPIFVTGVDCKSAIHFPKAWNKTFLPKPFTKLYVYWSGPIFVNEEMDPKSPELALHLEKTLDVAKANASLGLKKIL